MKLLGWMHRKFRHNGGTTNSDFIPGQEAAHGRLSYREPPPQQSEIFHLMRKSFAGVDAVKIEFCGDEGRPKAEFDGLFHGFLAIGTLGLEPCAAAEEETDTFEISIMDEMPVLEFLVADETPALELSVEEVLIEKETAITENELNLINEELGKALMAAIPDKDGSSGWNSYVSTGRSSHASGGATTVCPLQGYLLGSAAEVPGIKDEGSVPKKEQRTTLKELFRITDEEIKEVGSSCLNFRGAFGNGSSATAATPETKLQKIMRMFQKKVHPEARMPSKKSLGKHKKVTFAAEVKQKTGSKRDVCGCRIPTEMIVKPEDMEKLRRMKCAGSKIPQTVAEGNESNRSRECWIKTDEDYLVLEL